MEQELETLLSNVDKLKPGTKPQWGKMSPQQMVEHLQLVFDVSAGVIPVRCFTPESKIPVMKAFLMGDKPMPKNFVSPATGEQLPALQYDNLETAKDKLLESFARFNDYFTQNPDAKTINPTFGELSYHEWMHFHKKHVTHHFTQFGLI